MPRVKHDHVRIERHGLAGKFAQGVGVDRDHGEVDHLDRLSGEAGVPARLHQAPEMVVGHGKTGRGRFTEDDDATNAFRFACGDP